MTIKAANDNMQFASFEGFSNIETFEEGNEYNTENNTLSEDGTFFNSPPANEPLGNPPVNAPSENAPLGNAPVNDPLGNEPANEPANKPANQPANQPSDVQPTNFTEFSKSTKSSLQSANQP
jgi:hypothetical protein